jgi:streptogramin lyase
LNATACLDHWPNARTAPRPAADRGEGSANLNTASSDRQGILWLAGQKGIYGHLDPKTGAMAKFDAPHGVSPYGIANTPDGQVFFASFAGNYPVLCGKRKRDAGR